MQRANGTFWHWFICKERMDFILAQHPITLWALWSLCNIFQTTAPPSLFMPDLSHPDLDIQATRPPLCFLWKQYLLMICHTVLEAWFAVQPVCGDGETPPLCCGVLDRAGCPLSQIKGSSSGTVAEPTASGTTHYYMRGGTCDLFNYSALHFYPTIQNATWELIASKIHLYNLPKAHKLSNFGAGWTSRAGTSRSLSVPHHCSVLGEQNWMGLLFCWLKTGGKKSTLVILWTLKHVR